MVDILVDHRQHIVAQAVNKVMDLAAISHTHSLVLFLNPVHQHHLAKHVLDNPRYGLQNGRLA
jgi:hypothetical protein